MAPTPPLRPRLRQMITQLATHQPARAHALVQTGAGWHAGPTPRVAPPPKPKSQSVDDVANQRVNQQLAPILASQQSQAQYQNQAIQGFALALLGKLSPIAGQVGSDYDKAIGQVGALSQATGDALRGANPNAADQQMLQSIGAPAEQQQQLATNLGNVFNGGAAAGQFLGGEVPGRELAADKASSMAAAHQLPGIAALKGQQDLASAMYSQRQERATTLAQRPGLVQAQTQEIRGNIAAKQAAAFDQYKFQTARADALEAAGQKQQADALRVKAQLDYKYAALNATDRRAAQSQQGQNARTAATIQAANARAAAKLGAKAGGKPATTSQINSFVKSLPIYGSTTKRDAATGTSTTTKSRTGFTMPFTQAYRRLRNMGLDDATARQTLQSVYPRGAGGRSWLTNEEQSTLKQAAGARGQGGYAGLKGSQAKDILRVNLDPVSKHRFLSPIQYEILKAAGKLPPGAFQNTPVGKRWYVKQ